MERDEINLLLYQILNVGVVLPDHTVNHPSVIYGHPTSRQWADIFILAAKIKTKE